MKAAKFFRIFLFSGMLVAGSLIASAQSAGYDFFQTGTGSVANLSNFGLGSVAMQGVPIMSSTGSTDTIIHRTASGPGAVPINVYAMFLKSSSPVIYGGVSADVYATINNSAGAISTSVLPQPDSLTPSTGTITIYPTFTFDSTMTVNADIIIVNAGASPAGPSLAHGPAIAVTPTTTGSTWSTTAPAGYPMVATLPSGGFYPVPAMHNSADGPHHHVVPASCGTGTAGSASPTQKGPTGNAIAIARCISVATTN